MKMNSNTIWTIILVISLFLIIHGMSNSGDTDKKTAQAAQSETVAGSIGAIASFIGKKGIWGIGVAAMPWVIGGIMGLLLLIPNFLGNMIDLFRPTPSIPVWVWIVGFFVLILLVLKKK